MKELARLISIYLNLQKTFFQPELATSIISDVGTNVSILEVVTKYCLKDTFFSLIIAFDDHKLIISFKAINQDCDGAHAQHVKYGDIEEKLCSVTLKRVIFVCEKDIICFWSPLFNMLIRKIISQKAHAFVLEKNRIYDGFNEYVILPYNATYSNNERFLNFHTYIYSYSMGCDTKDSDFLLKHAFNTVGSVTRDASLVAYLERVYTTFIYGYIETPYNSDLHSRTIFGFWFEDLYSLDVFECGISHIGCGSFGQLNTFYFILACRDKKKALTGLAFLQCKYQITVMAYTKSPSTFVAEFMHYKAELASFNTYFIGIFNREDWVLYSEVFQKIRMALYEGMGDAADALEVDDCQTIEEKYKLRFACYRYKLAGYPYNMEEEYSSNNVPWLALPEPLVTFTKIRGKGGMESPDFSGKESLLLK